MSVTDDFNEIMEYAHYWNWLPDWDIAKKVYLIFPASYSVLLPFAYTYLEEVIRSMTSEYGIEIFDKSGNPMKRKSSIGLIELAIKENNDDLELVELLEKMKTYYTRSSVNISARESH